MKIGYYVHYNASRYIKYGTTKDTKGKEVGLRQWNEIKHYLQSKIIAIRTDKQIKTLENKYNAYRALITTNQSFKSVRDKIIKLILSDQKNNNSSNLAFNFTTGNVFDLNLTSQAISQNSQTVSKLKSKQKKTESPAVSYANSVLTRFNQAYNQLQTISSVSSLSTIKKALQNAEQNFLKLAEAGDREIKELKLTGVHVSKGALVYREQANEAIKTINTILGITNSGHLVQIKGQFEEYIAAAASLLAQGYAANEIVNKLENEIKKYGGGNKTMPTINSDMLAISKTASAELAKNKDYTFQDAKGNSYKWKLSPTEQKMDAYFIYDPINNKGAALSIKNYNLSSSHPIHLVTKSPLSSFLFNIGRVDYINHYLNILANHKNEPSTFKLFRGVAEEGMGYYILYAAMSGRGVGKTQGMADVFVVNDNSKANGVKMYDIGGLVNNIISKGKFKNQVTITPALSDIKLVNNFVKNGKNVGDNIQRRLTYLLASVRAQKISASLNPSALRI